MKRKSNEAKNTKKSRCIDTFFGVPIFSGNREEVLKIIDQIVRKKALKRPYFVVTINTEFLVLAEDNIDYKEVLKGSDLNVPDSVGLRMLGVKEIYPGRKLMTDLILMNKYRIFYLGGKPGETDQIVSEFGGRGDPGERDVWKEERKAEILRKINRFRPDILFVAYGGGLKQEIWIQKNLRKLKAKVVIGVGGAFDYLTGNSKLPPVWIEKAGLEWLWRLIQEPWRWRRQTSLIKFVWKVLISKLF